MIKVTFILRDGVLLQVEAEAGQTMLQLTQQYGLDVEGPVVG